MSYLNYSLNETQDSNKSDEVYCVSRHKPSFLTFCLFPALAILINVVILVAVLRKARKLMRQSHVYAHVSSTLIGNVLFSLLSLLQILILYFNFGGYPDDPNPAKRGVVHENSSQWWTFHKSFLCGMYVIMCGNIGLLIDSIRHNTCSTLRTAAGHRSYQKDSGNKWKKKRTITRRQRSYLVIALLWLIPLVFVVIPVGGWNCTKICSCLSQCFPPDHTYKPSDFTCSRIVPPITNSWLAVVVVAWLSGVIATICLLKRSLQKVSKMWAQSGSKRSNQEADDSYAGNDHKMLMSSIPEISKDCKTTDSAIASVNTSDEGVENCCSSDVFIDQAAEPETSDQDKPTTNAEKENKKNNSENEVSQDTKYYSTGSKGRLTRISNTSTSTLNKTRGSAPHRRVIEQLRYTRASTFSLRYVICLTVTFIVCTAPTMALISMDILNPNLTLNMVILNSCLMCPFIYCYICPFILVKCLPGVKTSLSALILSVYSTTD